MSVLILCFVGCCAVASARDTFFPKVHVAGVDVSGLTYEQAADKLSVYSQSNSDDQTLTVYLGSYYFDIPVNEVMDEIDFDACLNKAWQFGHGGFFSGGIDLISSIFSTHDFAADENDIDSARVRAYTDSAANELSGGKEEPSYTINDSTLLLHLGKPGGTVDAEKLYETVMDALLSMDFSDIDYPVDIDEPEQLDIEKIYKEITVEKKDATFDSELNIIPETVGLTFDLEGAKSLLAKADYGDDIAIPLIKDEPEITSASLAVSLCTDVLSQYSTYVTSNSNRNNNISLACQAINGTILLPGDVFSFNDIVGQRTTEKGYLSAGAYANGEVINEVGGGICQVSSTIYMCSLLADLEIVHRECHQFVVTYLPYGMDATVNWGTIDFQFKNDTKYPIKIEAGLSNGAVNIRLLGTKENDNTVEMTYSITATYPFSTIEKEDSSVPEGQTIVKTTGSTGYSVVTYRNVYNGSGELISSAQEATSYYSKRDKVVLIPIKQEEPEQPVDSPEPSTDPTEPPVEPTDPTDPPVDPTEPTTDPTTPPAESTDPPTDPTTPPTPDGI